VWPDPVVNRQLPRARALQNLVRALDTWSRIFASGLKTKIQERENQTTSLDANQIRLWPAFLDQAARRASLHVDGSASRTARWQRRPGLT